MTGDYRIFARGFRLLSAFAMAASVTGCATTFEGDAQFPGGAEGCHERCENDGMEMATFVYVGEYSSACACRDITAEEASEPQAAAASDEAATVAAAAGVETQRRRAAQQRQGQY